MKTVQAAKGIRTRLNRDHEDILTAIVRRDPDAARAAMRIHLSNSRERLRQSSESIGTT